RNSLVGGGRELERVPRGEHGLVAVRLDPRRESQHVEQRGHLVGRRGDQADEARLALAERGAARQCLREAVDRRERRREGVAGEGDEPCEALGDHRGYGSYPMTATRGDSPLDLQAAVPEVQLGLQRVGLTNVAKAIRIEHAGEEKAFAAEISCVVDLDPAQKGVHMSRFPELFGEAVDEVVIGEALLVESLASHIAAHVLERQEAIRAEVRIEAQYPIERRTPATGLRTQEIAKLIGIASATRERVRRVVGVEATGINACPCAQGLVRGAAADRLLEAGFDDGDVERILELVPLATHNQRGRGTLLVGTAERLNAELLVEIVEGSMSSPIYELLKRPDELFVVEHAHLQPRFVEDSVRVALKSVLDELPQLGDADFVLSRQLNFETIHAHEVVAERHGKVGELRAELDGAGHGPASHTVLRDWLRT